MRPVVSDPTAEATMVGPIGGVQCAAVLCAGEPPAVAPVAEAEALGEVYLPLSWVGYQSLPLLEGTTSELLQHGFGHYTGTVLPGDVGNFAITGSPTNRDQRLSLIAHLRAGNPVLVETADTWYIYRVLDSPIASRPDSRLLTLTSCPVETAASPCVTVRAELEMWRPRSDGWPSRYL